MATVEYDIDPILSQNGDFALRSQPGEGIAAGRPVQLPFLAGGPLDAWSVQSFAGPGGRATPYDGYLRFEGNSAGAWGIRASLVGQASLNNTVVTVAFQLRANVVSNNTTFLFPGGLILDMRSGGYGYFGSAPPQPVVGLNAPSAIAPDGSWHRIVMAIQNGIVILWEDDVQKVTWTPPTPLGDALEVSFGLVAPAGHASFDLGDVTLLVGTTQIACPTRAAQQSNVDAISAARASFAPMAALFSDVVAAAGDVIGGLTTTRVGPGSLFWGIDVSPNLAQAVRTFAQDPRVTRFRTQAAQSFPSLRSSSGGITFAIGIGMTASFVLSGGYLLGFLIGDHGIVAFLSLSAGGVTNIGIQGSVEAAFYPLVVDDVLGLGCSVQISGGEVFQGAISATGNVPLHMRAWDNCGPGLIGAVGVSELPIDIGGGFSYTFEMARLS